MENVNYWEFRARHAKSESEFRTAMDKMMLAMVDANMISMSWCDEKEDFVFFMNEEQTKNFDMGHAQNSE